MCPCSVTCNQGDRQLFCSCGVKARRCIPSPAASSWAVLVARGCLFMTNYTLTMGKNKKQKKPQKKSHLDWYIHEVTRAHNKRRAGTGFHSYCMLSLMNPARGSLWQVPVTFQRAAVFSVHIRRANETLNVSFPVLENSCCRDWVTAWGIKPLLFLPLKNLTPFRLPGLHINAIILFTPSDPYRWFTESRCAAWMVEMEIPCNVWTFFHPSERGQKFKRQDMHFLGFFFYSQEL